VDDVVVVVCGDMEDPQCCFEYKIFSFSKANCKIVYPTFFIPALPLIPSTSCLCFASSSFPPSMTSSSIMSVPSESNANQTILFFTATASQSDIDVAIRTVKSRGGTVEELVRENAEPPKYYAVMSDAVLTILTYLPQVSYIAPQGHVSEFALYWLGVRLWRFAPRYPRPSLGTQEESLLTEQS
jgi:hypothetical protein